MKYILAIDQSTQGTKVLLFDDSGKIISNAYKTHLQLVDKNGYISHDLDEIYHCLIHCVHECVDHSKIDKNDLVGIGLTNQRETSCMWNNEGPICNAVVWQCSRGKEISDQLTKYKEKVFSLSGLPLSPYFPASKMKWLINHHPRKEYYLGTVDSYLIYKLTGNFYTDISNAARTQLFNIKTLKWDDELCSIFGIDKSHLPIVKSSDSNFGETDFDGYLPKKIPIYAVLGDSNAALYAHGCHNEGDIKATYGTGSSVMMNSGSSCLIKDDGLATSIAWEIANQINYVFEGNINYSCAIISWLKDDVGLIKEAKEISSLANVANPNDNTILIPAFSGLSAPHWKTEAKASITNMSRTTGKNEIAKAAEESIVFQIQDVLDCLKERTNSNLNKLYVDGGAINDSYLMQSQSDYSQLDIYASSFKELSACGVAYLAGLRLGIYNKNVFKENIDYKIYTPNVYDKYPEFKR